MFLPKITPYLAALTLVATLPAYGMLSGVRARLGATLATMKNKSHALWAKPATRYTAAGAAGMAATAVATHALKKEETLPQLPVKGTLHFDVKGEFNRGQSPIDSRVARLLGTSFIACLNEELQGTRYPCSPCDKILNTVSSKRSDTFKHFFDTTLREYVQVGLPHTRMTRTDLNHDSFQYTTKDHAFNIQGKISFNANSHKDAHRLKLLQQHRHTLGKCIKNNSWDGECANLYKATGFAPTNPGRPAYEKFDVRVEFEQPEPQEKAPKKDVSWPEYTWFLF